MSIRGLIPMNVVIGVVVGMLIVGFLRKQFPTLPF